MFSGLVYFAGPKSRWPRSNGVSMIHESEVIARTPLLPWRWLARRMLLELFDGLDKSRCGYALMDGDECVEHYDPPLEG